MDQLYRDLHGKEFIKVAENATEVFLAPVTGSHYKDETMEMHMDYSDIRVFEREQPGYYIKVKNKVLDSDEVSYEY